MDQQDPLGGQPLPPVPDAVASSSLPIAATEPPPPLDVASPTLPSPPGAPPFTIRALLKDTFARYAGDFLRLFLLALVASVVQVVSGLIELGRAVSSGQSPTSGSSVLGVVFGAIWGSVLFALIGGGRSGSVRAALGSGLRRSFRTFLASFAIGIAAGAVAVAIVFPASWFLATTHPLIDLVNVGAGLLAAWIAARLCLALPGVAVDGLGASDALSLSWRVTRPVGVWLRIALSVVLVFLLFVFALLGPLILALFAISTLVYVGVVIVATAVFAPVLAVTIFSAYRRLVPTDGLDWVSDPSTAPFATPTFGRGAKGMVVAALLLAIGGVVGVPVALNAIVNDGVTPGVTASPDLVPAGKILFGDTSDPLKCEVHNQRSTFTAAEGFAWVGAFSPPTSATDKIELRVTQGGVVLGTIDEQSGRYRCLGLQGRDTGLPEGTYLIEILVNGQVKASGTVTLT